MKVRLLRSVRIYHNIVGLTLMSRDPASPRKGHHVLSKPVVSSEDFTFLNLYEADSHLIASLQHVCERITKPSTRRRIINRRSEHLEHDFEHES